MYIGLFFKYFFSRYIYTSWIPGLLCHTTYFVWPKKYLCAGSHVIQNILSSNVFFNSFIIQNVIQLFFLNYFIMQFFLNSFYHTIVFFTSTKYFAFIQNILHEWMQNILYECKIFCVHTKHFAFIQNILHSYKIFAFIQNIYFISP